MLSRLPILLDGPTGTELERRGCDTTTPIWSARALLDAPELVEQILLEYIEAGADVVTTNSFRTNRRAIERAGYPSDLAEDLTRRSVEIAVRARERSGRVDVLVAGADAPVEDCYSPWLVPEQHELVAEHAEHIRWLADAGSDLILIETINTLREAVAAAEGAAGLKIPFMVSFVTDVTGRALLSGESLAAAAERIGDLGPFAILVNCSSPRAVVEAGTILADTKTRTGALWHFGGYPNGRQPDAHLGYECMHDVPVDELMGGMERLLELGAMVIGTCCGTTPEQTNALRRAIDRRRH